MRRHSPMIVALALALSACGQGGVQVDAKAQAAAREQDAAPVLADFDSAYTAGDWGRARLKIDELHQEYAGTQAEAKAMAHYDEVKAKSDIRREEDRLKSLWDYQTNPEGRGQQISAALISKNEITLDGGVSHVQLIFRDHPEWKRSTYIVLSRGDIDCYKGCKVKVTVDGATKMLDGLRPDTKEAISMFINPDRALWKAIQHHKALTIEIPVKGGPKQTAEFEVGGLDPARMPKAWSAQ
ncbi:hypothetical protein [Solilutibacter silvestris]|nr:hypothetical protein [Lysobacter silvestris]